MPVPIEYKSSITREQFLYFETRMIAKYKADGYSDEEIMRIAIEDNILQMPTEKSIKVLTAGVLNKLAANNAKTIELIANASTDIAKQANLYAMMNYNRLVWDFMVTVVAKKYESFDLSFGKKDVNIFIRNLMEHNPSVSEWKESTIEKIRSVLIKVLVETEYLDDIKSETLNPVFLYDEVKEIIVDNGDEIILPAFNCLN